MNTCEPSGADVHRTARLAEVWRADRWTLLLASVLLTVVVARLMVPSQGGLGALLHYPLSYENDGIACLHTVRKLLDGWYLFSHRAGYPAGASFYDYPMSDTGSLLIIKVLGMLTGSAVAAANLYFLLGLPTAFAAAHLVLRMLGMQRAFAMACAAVFAVLPFHFLRLEHLFLTWYFQVPVYVYAGHLLYRAGRQDRLSGFLKHHWRLCLLLAALSSFGMYHAFFGALLICTCALGGWLRSRSATAVAMGAVFSASITLGLLANIAPHYLLSPFKAPNPDVATRAPFESELYGLKLTQLLVPNVYHRSGDMRRIGEAYLSFPLTNENHTAALGLIGGVGVIVLIWSLLSLIAKPQGDSIDRPLALSFVALFLFATVGGLSTVFASLVSPVIRGTNRASVFLGFLALAMLFFKLDGRFKAVTWPARTVQAAVLLVLVVIGLWDQIPRVNKPFVEAQRTLFDQDSQFIGAIEASLPRGAAVFQLPYMAYPESPPVHQLGTYGLTIGFTHSQTLRWSYGAMRGRPEDTPARAASALPTPQMLERIKALGFTGIYIDRRGYADGARQLERDILASQGALHAITHPAGHIVFYKLPTASAPAKAPLAQGKPA